MREDKAVADTLLKVKDLKIDYKTDLEVVHLY